MTGAAFKGIGKSSTRRARALVIENGGGRMVLTLTDELQTALADADDQQLASVAVQWSQIEEFRSTNMEGFAPWLRECAELVRRARSRGERLHCWAGIQCPQHAHAGHAQRLSDLTRGPRLFRQYLRQWRDGTPIARIQDRDG